jgi:hypothetical protein
MPSMKTLLAFAAALLAASACSDTPTQPRADNDTFSTLSPADGSFSQSGRKDISHRNEDGSFELITVAGNAVGAHLAHGDSYPVNGSCGAPSDPAQTEEETETGGDTAAPAESGSESQTPSSSGSGTAALVEDFGTYGGTTDMLSDPRGIYAAWEDINTEYVELDRTTGYGGSGQSMKYTWSPGNGTDITRSRSVNVQGLFGAGVQELWVEVVVKFDTHFTLHNPYLSQGEAYKLLHLNGPGSAGRFGLNFVNGDSGSLDAAGPNDDHARLYIRGNSGQTSMNSLNDGNWHTFRYHVRLGGTDFHEYWVDGAYQGSATGNTAESSLTHVSLGKNLNEQPPATSQSLWWGAVRVYVDDPGW